MTQEAQDEIINEIEKALSKFGFEKGIVTYGVGFDSITAIPFRKKSGRLPQIKINIRMTESYH
jgi:hypothetical protein